MKKSNDLLTDFLRYITDHNLFHKGDHLLVAVSGGADSVVLCDLCHRAGFPFVIAHCNFRLRGEESDRDETFVRGMGKTYQADVLVKHFDTETYASENKVSVQVAARELRYQWFRELTTNTAIQTLDTTTENVILPELAPRHLRYILTAHHADDNVETVMMNFFKGTGVTGLRGILPSQGNIIRPLLFAWKEELLYWVAQHRLAFVEDSSNVSDKYTRNYFRNELIPSIQQHFPAVKENLATAIRRYRDAELLYHEAIAHHRKKLLETKGDTLQIAVLKLKKTPAFQTIIYELFKPFGFAAHQAEQVSKLLDSESGRYVQSHTHRVVRNRKWLVITPIVEKESDLLVVEASTKKLEFKPGILQFKQVPLADHQMNTAPGKASLDASQVTYPMILRKWKQGDYFYPLGLGKKKKISRFLIDQKLSLPEKENTWVLEMDKKIIWVINRRIDDRFKVTGSTKMILQVDFDITGS